MQDYVAAMQPGTNLGNTLDAIPDETSWGNPPTTQALIQQFAAQGYKSIRLPVTWTHHTGAAPDYAVEPAWMNRVQQVVDWSLQAGLRVMINLHHDSWEWVSVMPLKHDVVLARYRAIWTQIATRFRDYPDQLMFESINEPIFRDGNDKDVDEATAMALLDELNTTFFNVVRATGGTNATRPLVLPTLATSATQPRLDSLKATITRLNDPNLIVTVHYYGFWPFAVNIAGYTKFDADSINDIVTALNAAYDTFVSGGIPVVVGEYHLLGWESVEHGELLKYFEYFTQYARTKAVTHMLWDAGQELNRFTYQWRDPDLYAMIRQGLTGRSTTTDTDLIFLKSGAAVQDAPLNVAFNGNSFVSLKDGTTVLTAGTDYTLSGSALTVKASTLSKYGSGAFGEKAVLSVVTGSGPAWKLHVRYYDTPVLAAASGTTSGGLGIPTAFNGDLLATMQAVYANGGNAGPASWTSFKEYGDSFSPDYANNTITITPKFFAETTAGTINLTFHFWSGKTLKYPITRTGNSVTGAPVSEPPPASNPPPTPAPSPATPSAPGSTAGGGGGGAPSAWFFAFLAVAWLGRRSPGRRNWTGSSRL
jgi:endoglucanase